MQTFESSEAEACASAIKETVPVVMRSIGIELHRINRNGISIPQFLALMTIQDLGSLTVSDLSEKLRSSLSAASKLVDGLVERSLVQRQMDKRDRRRVNLSLTAEGERLVQQIDEDTNAFILSKIKAESTENLQMIHQGMRLVYRLFQDK